MIVSSVTAFHLFNNLLCQHLATLYSLHFHDFVEDSARKSNAAKNVPRTSASHPKYIRVGKMLPVHDSDRCCLSQEHLVMWGCLKRLSSCQEELFFFYWGLMHKPSNSWRWPDTGVTDGEIPSWTRWTSCFWMYISPATDIPDVNLAVTGSLAWQRLGSFTCLSHA